MSWETAGESEFEREFEPEPDDEFTLMVRLGEVERRGLQLDMRTGGLEEDDASWSGEVTGEEEGESEGDEELLRGLLKWTRSVMSGVDESRLFLGSEK